MAAKKNGSGNAQSAPGSSEGRTASADLDRAIFTVGPSKTSSVSPRDLDRIDKEFQRISKIKD